MQSQLQCNVKDEVLKSKSDDEGTALLTATNCEDDITMCKNVTVMDAENMRTGRRQFQLLDPRH